VAPIALAFGVLRKLAEGWTEFVSRRWLWTIVLAAGVAVYGPIVASSPSTTLPPGARSRPPRERGS
jgi:hypothetical protein